MRELMAADRRSGIAGTWSGWPITTGPFGRSRNPMAILIQLAQIGLFLSCRARSRSSAWSSACGAAGAGAAGEADLDRSQDKGYLAYKAGTPRWLAWPRPAPRTHGGQPTG